MNSFLRYFLASAMYLLMIPALAPAQENNFAEDFSSMMAEVRAMNKMISQLPKTGTILTKEGLAAERKMMNSFGQGKTEIQPIVKTITGVNGNIDLRIMNPGKPKAVVLDIHGGAWSLGTAKTDDEMNDQMARACQVAVVSVDYRLAPESPFPACIEDCRSAAKWLISHAKAEFGTDKIIISGASAGAHLSAVTALYIRDSLKAIDKVIGVNLVYGCFDLSKTPSVRQASDSTLVLHKKSIDETFQLVFGKFTPEQLRNPSFSPLYANLAGMPPALFTVGTADPLIDDTYFMESRWRNAGNKTWLAVYPEGSHGFNFFPNKMGRVAYERMYWWIRRLCQ